MLVRAQRVAEQERAADGVTINSWSPRWSTERRVGTNDSSSRLTSVTFAPFGSRNSCAAAASSGVSIRIPMSTMA